MGSKVASGVLGAMDKTLVSPEYKVLLTHLREVRESLGITQIQLAERLNSVQSVISKCERGERRMDVIELRRWCMAIGMDLQTFVNGFEERLGDQARVSRSKRSTRKG